MKISILSAVHNEELHIQQMIESVAKQTHDNWELLFVSDGSTDATEQIIKNNIANEPRIRLVGDGEKIGKVAAFNRAYEESTGDLFVLLAGDDTLPEDSLHFRTAVFTAEDPANPSPKSSFCKLKIISADASVDSQVLPRGTSGAHSGGTVAFNRHAAQMVFPIPQTLISEDLWLTRVIEAFSEEVHELTKVGLNYRVHEGNSNPRRRPFDEMCKSTSKRHRAWEELLNSERFILPDAYRSELLIQRDLEALRKKHATVSILCYPKAPLTDKLAYASMSNQHLYAIRSRFYSLFSGWRGR